MSNIEMYWRDAKEEHPPMDGSMFIAWGDTHHEWYHSRVCVYDSGEWIGLTHDFDHVDSIFDRMINITHWMPMPPAPEALPADKQPEPKKD